MLVDAENVRSRLADMLVDESANLQRLLATVRVTQDGYGLLAVQAGRRDYAATFQEFLRDIRLAHLPIETSLASVLVVVLSRAVALHRAAHTTSAAAFVAQAPDMQERVRASDYIARSLPDYVRGALAAHDLLLQSLGVHA